MSDGINSPVLIPQVPVHILKGFSAPAHTAKLFCVPSLLAAPVMTRFPALITETPYWVYRAFSTLSHHPACQGPG